MTEPQVGYTVKELIRNLDLKMDAHHQLITTELKELKDDFQDHKSKPHTDAVSRKEFWATVLSIASAVGIYLGLT